MIRFTIFTSCLVAAGCFVGTNGKEQVLLSTKHVDEGATCPSGGNTVSTGADTNENSVLDDDEVRSTVSLCDADNAIFQSGVVAGDFETTPSWNLNTGSGPRSFDFAVTFPTPFTRPPNVVVGLSDLDSARVRVKVEATSIAATGFTLHVYTWSDTLIYGVHANWIAYTQ